MNAKRKARRADERDIEDARLRARGDRLDSLASAAGWALVIYGVPLAVAAVLVVVLDLAGCRP